MNQREHRSIYLSVRAWGHAVCLLLLCAVLLAAAWDKSGQLQYPYPLDDSYIHLSIADTWAAHGIPSPNASRPAFSSSSPLYSAILAFLAAGSAAWVYWPLVIGIITGLLLLFVLFSIIRKEFTNASGVFLWTILLTGPVPLLMVLGMEHILHVFVCLLFFMEIRAQLQASESGLWKVLILAFLVTSLRYEGIFLIAASFIILIASGKKQPSFFALSGGTFAIFLSGLVSVASGSTFFPLSLLMKGHLPGFSLVELLSFLEAVLTRLYEHPFMFVILSISAIGWAGKDIFANQTRRLAAILQITSWGQVLFAEIGGYRYEAWLVILHGVLLLLMLAPYRQRLKNRHLPGFSWLLLPLLIRSLYFTINYPVSVKNIFEQSIQTGQFISQYLDSESVAIQDIGAACFLSDFEMTDLAGIGDQEINTLFRNRAFNPASVEKILINRKVKFAVIQQAWMGWIIPDHWIAAGCWTLPDAFIVPNAEVFFWASDSVGFEYLVSSLREYREQLPRSVIESGPYVERPLPEIAFLP